MDYVLIGERTAMLTSSYDRRSPLRYLEKIGADLDHKEVDFWTGDFYVDFEFRGFRFELCTPRSDPILICDWCPIVVFDELLTLLSAY